MFTILIADDEKEEREGIAFLLEELGYPLTKVFAAGGKEALSYLTEHAVDILFTDVRMPIMDGLELSEKAKELQPSLEIIIFSGFSEFEYARTAISIGVASYILKPVNVSEFKTTLDQTLNRLKSKRQKQQDDEKQEVYAKKHLLFRLINQGVETCESDSLSNLSSQYFGIMLLEFDNEFFDMAGPSFESSLLSLVELSADYLNLNMCQSLLLIKEEISGMSIQELSHKIHRWILSSQEQKCYIAFSEAFAPDYTLSLSYAELERLMEYRFFLPDTFIFDGEATLQDYLIKEGTEETEDSLMEAVKFDLKAKDFTSLNLHLDILCSKYEKKTAFSHLYIKFVFSSLYRDIMAEFAPISEEELNKTIDRLYRSNDIKEITALIKEALRSREEVFLRTPAGASREVDIIKAYINEHYGEDLDLIRLAELVYLSPRYLSSLFKRVTGGGINKYIKSIRMEKARELLECSNIKIIDLSAAVGYKNLSYFCQNFREFYGETPEQYRNSDYYQNRSTE